MKTEDKMADSRASVNRALCAYSLLVIITTLLAWITYEVCGRRPYFRPIFGVNDRFNDLQNYRYKINHLSDGAAALADGLPVFNYPAPAAYVYKILLVGFPRHSVQTYLAFLALSALCFALVAWCATRPAENRSLGALVTLSTTAALGYPLWFTADRGNIEGVVWVLAAAGLCLLLRGKYLGAAVLIGISAAVKPFPALFFLLLLSRRKFKEVGFGVASAAILVVAALTALGPTPWRAYRDMQPGVSRYMKSQAATLGYPEEARFEHSLLDGMKSAALLIKTRGFHSDVAATTTDRLRRLPDTWAPIVPVVRIYPLVVLVGLALLAAVFYKLPILNQLTAAGVAVTLFPLVAADYTLLHLYVPFGALLVFLVREVGAGTATFPVRPMVALLVIYALLFAPLTFLQLYAGDAKMVLLIALLFVAARWPMRSNYFEPTQQPHPDATTVSATYAD